MTDKEVYTSIKKGGSQLELATNYIMESNLGFMHDIKSKLNLTTSDVKDIYSDSISNLIWNINTNKFKGNSKISTYLYRLVYNKSVDHLRHISTNKNKPTENLEKIVGSSKEDLETDTYNLIAFDQVKKEILSLSNICNSIIMDWAFYGYSMQEIASRNNLSDANKAKKQKYNCLQKLRSILKSKGIDYDE